MSYHRLSKVRGSWFLEATDFCHPQARQIHRCIFAPVTSVNAHYYSVLTMPFDMVNAHYVIIDFRAKFFIKIQNQASDTSRSLGKTWASLELSLHVRLPLLYKGLNSLKIHKPNALNYVKHTRKHIYFHVLASSLDITNNVTKICLHCKSS